MLLHGRTFKFVNLWPHKINQWLALQRSPVWSLQVISVISCFADPRTVTWMSISRAPMVCASLTEMAICCHFTAKAKDLVDSLATYDELWWIMYIDRVKYTYYTVLICPIWCGAETITTHKWSDPWCVYPIDWWLSEMFQLAGQRAIFLIGRTGSWHQWWLQKSRVAKFISDLSSQVGAQLPACIFHECASHLRGFQGG